MQAQKYILSSKQIYDFYQQDTLLYSLNLAHYIPIKYCELNRLYYNNESKLSSPISLSLVNPSAKPTPISIPKSEALFETLSINC